MKKFLSMLLILCLFLGALPAQALAYVADNIQRADTVEQVSVGNSSLVLQNDYIRMTLNKQDGSLTTSPAATSSSVNQTDKQKPFCEFVTWKGYGYNKQELVYPTTLRLKNVSFVNKTPNGDAKAIKVEYDLTTKLPDSTLPATTAVYYELVQCKEDESSEDTWGVLTTVSSIYITGGYVPPTTDSDAYMPRWGYTLDDFTGMGHANATDSPAHCLQYGSAYGIDRKLCSYQQGGKSVYLGRLLSGKRLLRGRYPRCLCGRLHLGKSLCRTDASL